MNKKRLRQHTIDFIFPIALFFVFAASSLVVLILSANIYRNITENSRSLPGPACPISRKRSGRTMRTGLKVSISVILTAAAP